MNNCHTKSAPRHRSEEHSKLKIKLTHQSTWCIYNYEKQMLLLAPTVPSKAQVKAAVG